MDETDLKVLDLLQVGLPLVQRPFAPLADRVGLNEEDLIQRVNVLRYGDRAVIRQISAIFDSRSLGYQTCLVAAKVDDSKIDQAAVQISRHPGVSHNYRRNHAYNLWYTVAVPPDSRLGLERTVELLHQHSGAILTRLMPALKVFKIGVKFNLGETEVPHRVDDAIAPVSAVGFHPTAADKRIICVLQQDLPLVVEPFDVWAKQAKVSTDMLLLAALDYQERGIMRRFSAVLRHREAGFGANAMGAWVVPPEQCDRLGALAASFSAVSHCYQRPTYPDWPYSVFTMVHARQPQECEVVLADISRASEIREYAALYSTHEYKKVRVRYFTEDIERWENE